ncbi:hypothetical protein BGZ70_008362 [Mortierella alpina]|uniref:Centromere protein W n=1 Tax=Mortierella alpina TaxID=64518 RepID=A0A9P6M1W1_MORAP|nr:hypothetical protein BGZ68_000845 [Mortierella alpina]KAF9935490.1 hypothetical protein BGZ67_003407 [Mortierella alpina]KAF9960969.1 hypothetical protein BGZ72_005272 [Mortierella alpina]KAF9961126.1 hypothetical protein BGZ70_008362 [Mortierella alpina]KAF9983239.1 hypothetical protein BGZ75_005300 [Mortierella antarctica]
MTRIYPRKTLRRIIQAHEPTFKLSRNADIKVYVLYLMFLQRIVAEASRQAQMNRDSIIQSRHVTRALKMVLQQFKG